MARRENRFVKYWLAPIVLVVVLAGMGIVTTAVLNSWWVDREQPPSTDQRADDGTSLLTPAGLDYGYASGVLILRVGDDAMPASALGLDAEGERLLDGDVPFQVRILAPDGALVLDLMDSVLVTTDGDRITRLDIVPWNALSYREMIGLLESRAETVGWSESDLRQLDDDLAAAAREREGDTYSAVLAPGTALGVAVSATVSVDLAASYTGFVLTVEP